MPFHINIPPDYDDIALKQASIDSIKKVNR
jgi:hypothetical protein